MSVGITPAIFGSGRLNERAEQRTAAAREIEQEIERRIAAREAELRMELAALSGLRATLTRLSLRERGQ
jgi:hypothetical protein